MTAAVTITLPLGDVRAIEVFADGPAIVVLGKAGQIKATCKDYVTIRAEESKFVVTSPADGTTNIIISGMKSLADRYILDESLPEPTAEKLSVTTIEVPLDVTVTVLKAKNIEIRDGIIVKDERP